MNSKELQARNLSLKWSWFDIQNNTYDGLIGITSIHIIRRDLLVCHSIKVDSKYGQHITRTKHFFFIKNQRKYQKFCIDPISLEILSTLTLISGIQITARF